MKKTIFSIGLLAAWAVSCSIHEMDFKDTNALEEFYASIENTENPDTKVYATEELYLRWNADDRITIFNKYTYNQEYRFTGETGDNSGSFKRVDNGDFVTGNSLDNIYAIYPYLESTRISDTGVITVTLPAEQKYAENTMGLGANTMISATTDNQLLFKNVGGYLMLKLYGDDVTVSSISLKGNNGEKIAGKATVSMPINGVPSVAMSETAGQEITLVCETPVKIGSTAETATTFWIVVPPTAFSKGFTLTVKDNNNGVFEKATSKSFEISRNKLARMSALKVNTAGPLTPSEAITFADRAAKYACVAKYDTNGDGEVSIEEAEAAISFDGLFNNWKGVASFDEIRFFKNVHSINGLFNGCNRLVSITIPENITDLGTSAFSGCSSLSFVGLPSGITAIGDYTFFNCSSLDSVDIPINVTLIGQYAFNGCSSLAAVELPTQLKTIGKYAFCGCGSLIQVVIPEGVTKIPAGCFQNCYSLTSVSIPPGVTSVEGQAFDGVTMWMLELPSSISSLETHCFEGITCVILPSTSPVSIEFRTFDSVSGIFVPSNLIEMYSVMTNWTDYASILHPIDTYREKNEFTLATSGAVDMGTSVKWAAYNVGATKPEEYGDYFAWGEVQTKTNYSWSTYFDSPTRDGESFTKYFNGEGGKTELDPEDDVAYVRWGGKWSVPTYEEWTELVKGCYWELTTYKGVNGYEAYGLGGGGYKLFFPAASGWVDNSLDGVGSFGRYWSSSLRPEIPSYAWCMMFNPPQLRIESFVRYLGYPVRPVYAE